MAIQSLSGSSQFAGLKNQYKPGPNAGVLLNIGFKGFSIQPEISYSAKGEILPVQDYAAGGIDYPVERNNAELDYFEESVNVLYHAPISKNVYLQLGGGPYFGQGVSISITSGPEKEPASFSDDRAFAYHYKSDDYGINLIGGVMIKKTVFVNLQYGLGLANISNNTFPADNIKNRVISLSVGYLFNN